MDDIVSSDEEWEESDFGNPPTLTTNTESLFKPYLDAHKKVALEKRMNGAKRNIRATIDLAGKKFTKVGGVSIIWNPMCVVVMLEFRRIYNTHSYS
ncbi:hypothetical protein Tco_1209669 [Tanacetum coccineum]